MRRRAVVRFVPQEIALLNSALEDKHAKAIGEKATARAKALAGNAAKQSQGTAHDAISSETKSSDDIPVGKAVRDASRTSMLQRLGWSRTDANALAQRFSLFVASRSQLIALLQLERTGRVDG